MTTVTRLYDDYASAQQAVNSLESAGVPAGDISVTANNSEGWFDKKVDRDHDGADDRAEGASTGAGIGATLGGAAGVLAGLGLLAIPGLGPVVAAGWLAAAATGAVAGGATGGIIGALTQSGIGEEEANVYAEGVRRGGTLVTVRTTAATESQVQRLLDRSGVDLKARVDTWRTNGWKKFDPDAPAYTSEQVQAERKCYIGQ